MLLPQDLAQIRVAAQERVANPQFVFQRLFVQMDAGAHACMDEIIIADLRGVLQRLEKIAVSGRKFAREFGLCRAIGFFVAQLCDIVVASIRLNGRPAGPQTRPAPVWFKNAAEDLARIAR